MAFFSKVKLHNFLSFQDEEFIFNEGNHLVLGENRDSEFTQGNGAGKTALFTSIIYALYGKADRNLQRRNTDDTYVELYLYHNEDEVKIIRYYNHKKYKNKVLLFINETEQTTHTQKDTQKLIDSIIGIPYEHFISSVIIQQGMPVKILSLSPTQRKQFFSDILLFDFDNIVKNIKKDIFELEDKYNEKYKELNQLKQNLSFQEGKLSTLLSLQKRNNQDLDRVKKLHQEIKQAEKLKEGIEKIINEEKDLVEINKSVIEYKTKINVLNHRISEIDKLLDTSICPLCKSKVDVSLSKEKEELQNQVEQLEENLSELIIKKEEIETLQHNLKKVKDHIFKKQLEIKEILKQNQKSKEVEELDSITKLIEELKEKVEELEGEVFFIEDDLNKLKTLEKMLKPSGELRSVVLKSYLDIYNDILSSFLLSLFPEISLELVLDKKLQGIVIEGIDYNSLSGGEKRRLDIVIQLAFSEFITYINKVNFNLLVLDESFDGLDYKAVSNIISFITTYYEDKSIYVITHNENIKQFFQNVIKVIKEKGISHIEIQAI